MDDRALNGSHRSAWSEAVVSRRPLGTAVAGLVVVALLVPATAQEVRDRDRDGGGGWQSVTQSVTAPAASGGQSRWLPPAPLPQAYRLGIQVDNTQTGVTVLAVQPGSVAQRAGIEAGDTIITVSGYQVGYVGERLYDVGDELARRVDANGDATLVVRNRRTGGLVAVPVRFRAATMPAVTGRLFAFGPVALPQSAVVTVRLLDVTQPQWRDVAVTQGQLPLGTGFPVTYRLDLPPLPAQHRYAVDARVEDYGRVLMQTAQPVALAAVDRDAQVDLTLGFTAIAGQTAAGGLAPRDQIAVWIQGYLGRPPRPLEVEWWLADLQRGRSLANVQAGILSSSELFDRQGRSRDLYVAEVFRLLYGVPPSPAQLADLQRRYNEALGVRLRFVEGLLQQPR